MLFAVLLLLAAGLLWISRRPPLVTELDPHHASPGETVSVVGRNFGREGRLEIDGIAFEHGAIRSWSDNLIVFVMPRDVRSGPVRVRTEYGTSNPLFLTNQLDLPRLESPQRILVRTVSPHEARPGTVVTVRGENFGPRPARSSMGIVYPEREERISVSTDSWWITRWTNRELLLVIPPELPPGRAYLEIDGLVVGTDLTILPPTATVRIEDGETLVFQQSLRVRLPRDEGSPNVRGLLPRLPELPAQPVVQLLDERGERTGKTTPSSWVYRPVAEQRPEESGDEEEDNPFVTYEIERADQVRRHSLRWEIDSVAPVETLLREDFRRAFQLFLTDRDGVPVFSPRVDEIRRSSINLRNTPLVIARLIHREVQRRLEPDAEGTTDLEAALQGEGASARVYADLAAALLRISGLPARRHFGVLLADDNSTRDHVWLEVFLPGVGWIPMDPAIGDGMYGDDFGRLLSFYGDNPGESTLGSLDGRRITVHLDGTRNPRLFAGGAVSAPTDEFWSGLTLRVEAERARDLELSQMLWERPRVRPQN